MSDCTCSMGEADAPQFITENIRIARKTHKCCECGEIINIGDKYENVQGKWDGIMASFHTCIPCKNIREEYFCDWVYGDLQEAFYECFGYDYLGKMGHDEDLNFKFVL